MNLGYVKQLSKNGKNIFVDIVEFDVHYEHYCSILDCAKTVKILVYCPLDIVAEHVEKRNRLEQESEKRPLNLSFGQFQDMYTLQESMTDMVVDRIATSRMKGALQVTEQEVRGLMRQAGVDEKDIGANQEIKEVRFEVLWSSNFFKEYPSIEAKSWLKNDSMHRA